MEDNDWYDGIEKEIGSLKEKMSKGDSQLYELDLLSRVAKRVASFSSDCEHCQEHRNDISKLVTNLDGLPMKNEDVADYGRTFRSILKHLKKRHGLGKSLPSPVPYLIAAPLLFIISSVMGSYGLGTDSDTFFVLGAIGLPVAICTFLVGVVLSILRPKKSI
jgi:hypothetical protein